MAVDEEAGAVAATTVASERAKYNLIMVAPGTCGGGGGVGRGDLVLAHLTRLTFVPKLGNLCWCPMFDLFCTWVIGRAGSKFRGDAPPFRPKKSGPPHPFGQPNLTCPNFFLKPY
jgi:hypothetical protein